MNWFRRLKWWLEPSKLICFSVNYFREIGDEIFYGDKKYKVTEIKRLYIGSCLVLELYGKEFR